jgi:asparagine synthase (glutamine-hydrolysing)
LCGIAGILRVYDPGEPVPPPLVSIPEAWLDILDDSIKHRGPDGRGRFRDRVIRREDGATVDVALVHRRLSILDHAGGHQPMVSVAKGAGVIAAKRASGPGWLLYEDPSDPAISAWAERASNVSSSTRAGIAGDRTDSPASPDSPAAEDLIAVVFNGCIYNHRELRRELQAAGHVFTSDHSDTEVLVHGWREWGEGVFGKADGMYAVAIWDKMANTIAFARDPSGEKPLHLGGGRSIVGNGVVFSSNQAALLRLEAATNDEFPVRDNQLWKSFCTYWISNGFERVDPLGMNSQVVPGEVERSPWPRSDGRWWRIRTTVHVRVPHRRRLSTRLDVNAADSLLRDSIVSRLSADVPIVCFLSGGIDSALVCAFASRDRTVQSITVRVPGQGWDESLLARRTAKHLGMTHEVIDVAPDPSSDLLRLIPQIGLPFGDSSLLPSAALCRATRPLATVALSGDGGDELFCGYQRYQALSLLNRFKALHRTPTRLIPSRKPRGFSSKAHRLIMAMKGRWYNDLMAIFPSSMLREIVPSWDEDLLSDQAFRRLLDAPQEDFQNYLPHDLMLKSDSASMAVALEVRSPFLSRALIDACLSEPLSSLMPNGQRKGLLKQVARKYLPADIVDRPKQGFAIPIGEWFRSDYGGLRQLLLDHLLGPEPFGPDSLGINSMINMGFVKQMLKEHDDAGSASIWPWKGRDHSQRLYMLLVLSIWAKWLGGLARGSGQALPSSRSA